MLIRLSIYTRTIKIINNRLKKWTLFYWGWWIAWSLFVGMFIAKVSKGRTIRQFIIDVLFIPVGFTFLWMTVFGNSAIEIVMTGKAQDLINAANNNIPVALFVIFVSISHLQQYYQL